MMKARFLLFLCLVAFGFSPLQAQPESSTADAPVWYLVQFVNGGGYLTTNGNKSTLVTATPTGRDGQLFRFEENTDGIYQIYSREGLQLYTTSTSSGGFVNAAQTPATSNTSFVIAKKSGGFEIQPSANTNIGFNQYQGTSIGNRIALWDTGDSGNLLHFISEVDATDIIEAGKEAARMQEEMQEATAKGFHVIPFPNHVTLGDRLSIDAATLLATIDKASTILTGTVDNITFTPDATRPEEGYALTISSDGIVDIKASAPRGFYYGLVTLKQMALTDALYVCEITDAPKLQHRGLMLDIARHFFGMDELKKVIDVMSLYKLNRFHLHLTDDQGWRVQIPEYPLLTEVGAIRSSSLVNSIGTDGLYDDTEYGRGCYYTLEQLREIVAYASARQVDIMPEIDLPGHMAAAVASYPELSCDPSKTYEVRVNAGISSDLLAVHKPEVLDFLKCVLGHMAEVFPFKYIHIGGDECNVTSSSWQTLYDKNDADFKQFMKKYSLSGVTDVQAWLADTLARYLNHTYDKEIVVWNEVVSHWRDSYLKPSGVMCYSAGQKWEKQSADRGMYSISTPTFPFYLDMMQGTTKLEDPYKGGYGNNSVPGIYNYSILSVYGDKSKYCLGAQGNLWTESCHSDEEVDYCLFPRGIALSENCWMPESVKSWSNFRTRLQSHASLLDEMNVHYATQEIDLPKETNEQLAREYLSNPHPDEAGYPSASAYETLSEALKNGESTAINAALNKFRSVVNLTYPQEGKYYQIISAATYWQNRYLGASAYVKNGSGLHIHYTPQNEPEEVFCFVPRSTSNSYDIISALTGQKIKVTSSAVTMVDAEQATSSITVKKPGTTTSGSTSVSFRPGVVLLRTASAAITTDDTGDLKSTTSNLTYCYPTTWYLREITDFRPLVEGLVSKADKWLAMRLETDGSPTAESRTFLQEHVMTPAEVALEGTSVSADTYSALLDAYRQFLAMPTFRDDYPINFDKTTKVTHSSRRLESITLNGDTRAIPDNSVVFNYLSDVPFIVEAGTTCTAKLSFSGAWMHSYVYIDFGADGEFNVSSPTRGRIAAGDDLVSYSFFSEDPTNDNSGFNSAGRAISGSNRNTILLPDFKIAADTPAGDYRMRYKLDWNSIDPKGDIDNSDNNLFMNNGGAIADIILRVVAPDKVAGPVPAETSHDVYDLSGYRIPEEQVSQGQMPKGIYLVGGKKALVR
ncbi:MAG: beta-N-acetylhexosaminidase [Bacteroidaceae bacterium]|nr:beta-N-acetylhexosaminidase [Bacteroidaceae bacterium]